MIEVLLNYLRYAAIMVTTLASMSCGIVETEIVERDAQVTEIIERDAQVAEITERYALVIGNSQYQHLNNLNNPDNDSVAVGNKLETLGFEVIRIEDATSEEVRKGLTALSAKLTKTSAALVYFAGHGMQYNGKNYLLSVDDDIVDDNSILLDQLESAVSHDEVIRAIEKSPLKIVMLDACREIPTVNQIRLSDNSLQGRTARGMKFVAAQQIPQGLAEINAPEGTVISYSTQPNNIAVDSTEVSSTDSRGWHSPYVSALLKHLDQPGLSITEMLNEVAIDVSRATTKLQQPWQSSSPIPRFCFSSCSVPASADLVGPVVEEILVQKRNNALLWGIAGVMAAGLVLSQTGGGEGESDTVTVTTALP